MSIEQQQDITAEQKEYVENYVKAVSVFYEWLEQHSPIDVVSARNGQMTNKRLKRLLKMYYYAEQNDGTRI